MMHEFYMQRALTLSKMSLGENFPNPMVGAVIVKDGKIIGQGYHRKYGSHHAEVEAILNATESVEGADIYVSLEPCCHTNKQTPPCAQRLIKEKFKRVFISCLDPNPSVNGEGVKLLTAAGIEVVSGILQDEGERVNEAFFHAQRNKTPFINLKLAQSLDGKIALPSGESQWITGVKARAHAHAERGLHQGVMIGANTLRIDNPKLNVRLENYQGPQPYRIVFTKSAKFDFSQKLFTDELKEKTLIYTQTKILNSPLPPENVVHFNELPEALNDLYQRKLINLYLEGGASLAGEFLSQKLINRLSLYLAPTILGEGLSSIKGLALESLKDRLDLEGLTSQTLGPDLFITGTFKR